MRKARRRRERKATRLTKKHRIMAMLSSSGGLQAPEMYRVTLPYTFLNKNSEIAAGWISQDHAMAMMAAEDRQVLRQNVHDLFGYDLIVLRRWLSSEPGAGQKIRKDIKFFSKELTGREAVIVYESDDDYSGRHRPADVTTSTWKPIITVADAVIASTKPLGEIMAEEAGLGKYYVAKNYVHYNSFVQTSLAAIREDPDKIVVMLAGTATHDGDWGPVSEAMPAIMRTYPNVMFKVAGNVPDYLYGYCDFVAPVHYSMYPALLRQADILCCSLNPDDPFNASKSYIKVVEGWSAARPVGKRRGGCAIIASKAIPYRGVVNHRHTGLAVDHTPEAWEEAIGTLVEDRLLRQKLQINGLKQAKGYDVAVSGWKDWAGVFSDILADRS